MVGAAELAELDRLELDIQSGNGALSDTARYLALLRKLKLRRPQTVVTHGSKLLRDSSAHRKLGTDVWTVYEQVEISALDCHCLDIAKECLEALLKRFPQSVRVGRLQAMWFEARGSWQQAEKLYANLLEEVPTDPQILKRKVAIAKAQGNLSGAVDCLNKYLEIYMVDYDAWRELSNIYISLQMYKQAAYCFEELILFESTNALFHLGYAELLYTMGGLDNLRLAKKYYAAAIELSGGKNMRALFGISLCGAAISQMKGRGKEDKESSDIQSLASAIILKEYKEKSPTKLALVKSILERQIS